MMPSFDEFSRQLLEEAKRFLEKAKAPGEPGQSAYLHAALTLGVCALEAHVNSVCDDFLTRRDLSVLDRSILSERHYQLQDGEFKITERLKMYRLEDRIEFLFGRFSKTPLDKQSSWWGQLQATFLARNSLSHPKSISTLTCPAVERALQSVIDALEALYKAVYKKPFPPQARGLNSTLDF
jgi:hypothetical protein